MFISRVPVLAISLGQSVGGDLVPFSWLSLPSQLCGRLALTPPHALLHLFCCGCSHTPGLPTLPSCSSLSGCPCVRVFATLVPQSLAMVCFPIRGTETCALDAVGSSGRGALVAEGRSRRRGVVRSSLVLLPPAIRGMPWTHRGRAVGPVPDPRPMAGVPGASMPSWRVSPQPRHFCCSTTSQGQYVQTNWGCRPLVTGRRGSGAGGRPGDHVVCTSAPRGSCPLLAQHPVSEVPCSCLFFCWDFSLIFPSYYLSIRPGGRRSCLTIVSDLF